MDPPLEPWLIEMLVCPESKAAVLVDGNWIYSTDPQTRRRYAIVEGVPNMLIDESETLTEDEFTRVMRKHGKLQ